MLIDLRPDHLGIVMDILRRHLPGREVWAFGSRASGAARPHSDLDLAVMGDAPLDFATLATLRDAFSESNLPFRVDVVDWASADEPFRRIILDRRVLLSPAA